MSRIDFQDRRSMLAALATTALAAVTRPALAQSYPSRPIRIVLEVAGGAPMDIYMRAIAQKLSPQLGQPIVIENMPGAGGLLAAKAVIRAAPDGYTLLCGSTSALILRPHLVKSAGIDLAQDLTPISGILMSLSLVLVSTSLPVKSMKDLIAYARANPDAVAYGTTGVGSNHHFNGEQIQHHTKIRLRHVPYKSSNESLLHLSSGLLSMVIANSSVASPRARESTFLSPDKVRLLAVVEKRTPLFPDTPALSEVIPGFSAVPNLISLFGPPKLPHAILTRLNSELITALATPEVKAALGDLELIGESPAAFQSRLNEQIANVRKIATAASMKQAD
ncbi:MAG TPA: tripartite tricarboxylate transporter substrate binding protein [Ramlibacter sp.]|nr:tripartite tricarboxylate transporter substrate binding protein [Ramlibacter sp.]